MSGTCFNINDLSIAFLLGFIANSAFHFVCWLAFCTKKPRPSVGNRKCVTHGDMYCDHPEVCAAMEGLER